MRELTGEEVKVSATFSKKIQIEQFQPIDASCSITEITTPEKAKETYDRLFSQCREWVEAKLAKEVRGKEDKKNAKSKTQERLEEEEIDINEGESPE